MKDREVPARLKFTALPEGRREQKFDALASISLDAPIWVDGPSGWCDPFLAEQQGAWAGFAPLEGLFDYVGPGVQPGRTWVIAPDVGQIQASKSYTFILMNRVTEQAPNRQQGDFSDMKRDWSL
jgi:hypothetical protein